MIDISVDVYNQLTESSNQLLEFKKQELFALTKMNIFKIADSSWVNYGNLVCATWQRQYRNRGTFAN